MSRYKSLLSKLDKSHTWLILSLTVILYLIYLQISVINLMGLKNISIFFKTSSKEISIILIIIAYSIISYCMYIIYNIISKQRNNISFPSAKEKYNILFIIIFLIFLSSMVIKKYNIYLYNLSPIEKKATVPDKYKYKAGPIVQPGPFDKHKLKSTSNSMVIWWFDPGSKNKNFEFKYGESPDEKSMTIVKNILSKDDKRYEVILKDLAASKKYYYKITGFSEETYSFATMPENNNRSFHFISVADVTDTGKKSPSFSYNVNLMINYFYNKNKISPLLKLQVGDIAHRGTSLNSWKMYFDNETLQSSKYPYIVAIGNHETYRDNGKNFEYFFSQPRYCSFDIGNAHFLIIDTFDGLFWTTGSEQYEFIKQDLEENRNKKWIIVSIHTPLISTGDFNMNELMMAQFFDLFKKNKVDLVLSGHDHSYDSFHVDKNSKWGGTLYIVNGCGGSPLDYYLMTRNYKKWKTWFHDRNSESGLYQDDEITQKYHIYGELSWGFLDVEVGKNFIKTTYYRWIDIEKYLEISEQELQKWKVIPLSKEQMKELGIYGVKKIQEVIKFRKFQ